MKMNIRKYNQMLYVLLAFISFSSCKNKAMVINNVSYSDMFSLYGNDYKSICVILYDPARLDILDYTTDYRKVAGNKTNSIFNFVDVNSSENAWYFKMFRPEVLPLACIFDPNGALIDLIPGNSKESLLYIRQVLKETKPAMDFHFNGWYGENKIEKIKFFNDVLLIKKMVDAEQNAIEAIERLSDKMYPYLWDLKLRDRLQSKDMLAAKEIAKAMLEYNSVEDLMTYSSELYYASHIFDSTYNCNSAPRIKIKTTEITLDKCMKGNRYPIIVDVENIGHKNLKIFDIVKSCSCLELMSDTKEYEIFPNEHALIGFVFTPDQEGEIFRDVYIASNDYKTPISHIIIKAMVR